MKMNTAIVAILTTGTILFLGLITLVTVMDKDVTSYIGSITSLIGILASTGIITAMLNKNTKTTEQTQRQTNGTLSKKDDEINALKRALSEHGIPLHEIDTTPADEPKHL